ncbi:MAG: class I SAM-dependent methyltransferase [Polyangia bacterium]
MSGRDEHEVHYASIEQADRANKAFYEKFGSFPAPPRDWLVLDETTLVRDLLLQELGDWSHSRLPDGGRIWVAGCGASQAVEVALQFPRQHVLATDLSEVALAFGAALAKNVGVTNLELKLESIFDAPYESEFDLVVCRGVIHHTANPPLALQKLARAMKPDGLLDLAVLNDGFSGWSHLVPFQKALRLLTGSDPDSPDFELDVVVGKQLAVELEPSAAFITKLQAAFPRVKLPPDLANVPPHYLASMLSEPNVQTFTVASLDALFVGAGLALLAPYSLEPFMNAAFAWDMALASPELRARYDALPQKARWQITNLLMPDQPRVLRFYGQRLSSTHPVKNDQQLCEEFLARRFEKVATEATVHVRSDDFDGTIVATRREAFPARPEDPALQRVLDTHDERRPMGDAMHALGVSDFREVNALRRHLTAPSHPFLRAL